MTTRQSHAAYLRDLVTRSVANNGFKGRWSVVSTIWPKLDAFAMRYAAYVLDAIPPDVQADPEEAPASHLDQVFLHIKKRIDLIDKDHTRYFYAGDRPLFTAFVESIWSNAEYVACFEVPAHDAHDLWLPTQGSLSDHLGKPSTSPTARRVTDAADQAIVEAVRRRYLESIFPKEIWPFVISLSPDLVVPVES